MVQSICAQEKSLAIEVLRVAKSVHHTFAKPTVFGVKPEKETRAANGYVGLRNLGSTCYMNSLLQILFMNKTIKNYLLYHIPILDDQSEEETKNDLPLQLKKVFLYLEYSEKKSYAPLDWTFAFKDELGINPTNVSQQQDAQEFLQLLCERFETSIDIYRRKLESKGASTIPVDILRHTFGGKLCNQVFQSQCNGFSEGKMKDIREQEESFVCISLEVKNSKDLVTSLGKFVQGEEISDYLWEDNCPRVTITKRQVISELSDMVIFHLKRFELNFDTFHREKVNDSFSFPQNLNLFPFTKEGVNQIDNNSTSDEEYYEYELTGIIVHTGTSDSGHYYSFIKATKTGKENKWYEFNDADVSNFQEIMIEAECFGGTTVSHEYIAATQQFIASEMTNQKNAYMLVYNRKNKLNDKIADVEDSMTNLKRILDASAPEESLSFRKNVMMDVAQSIAQENAEHAVMVRVINLNHFNFCYELLQIVDRETRALKSESMLLLMCEVLRESYSLVVNYILRSTHVNMFQKFGKMLLKLLPDYQQLFFDHITETPTEETKASSNADYQNSRLAAIKFPLFKSIMESFVSDIGHFLCNLTVAKEELRKLFAELVMLVISLYQDCRTDQFYDPNIGFTSLNVGTISNSFSNGGGSTNGAFAAVATAVGTASSVPHQVGNYQHAHAIDTKDDIDFDDEELQMAIKMSQELMEPGGVEFPKGDVIDFAEAEDNVVATVAEPLDGNEDPMDVEKDIEESIPATDFEAGNGSEAEDPFQNKMIEKLLFNLTLDANIQSLAENWRRSGSYIWLLLELAKNSAVVRDYFLQREAISGVVNLILAEQSPLCDVLYVKSSRKHAPSSYVYVGKTKDGNCTCAAKNIPDWTCLMELIAILISNSRVGNMYHDSIVDVEVATSIEKNLVSEPYLSVWDRQCLTTKTLYSTLFRQERYVPATSVIITQLSVDNIQFSNLIAEVIYEEFSLANAESTYHIFMAMDSFLSISDSLAIQRARTLFGAGNSNIFQLMSTMKDQPLRSRLICVFIRSFVFLANKIPSLMTAIAQPSSHMHNWVPWMLRFSYRYVNRCNQENNERSAIAAAAMMQQQSRVEAVSTMPDIVSKGNESTKDPTSDSLSLQTPALVPPPPPHKALEESISSSQSKNPRVENLSIITDTQSIADTPPVTKGTFVRVYGEDESERELPWLVRAEKALESLIALVVSTGAILETFIPEDTFSESIAEVAAAAEVNNSVPFDPVTASMQDADMMTDEQLAEFLLNHKFDNDLD